MKNFHSQSLGTGREWKNPFPKFGNGKGMKKDIPEIRKREGNEKIHFQSSGTGIRGLHSWEWPGTGIPAHPWTRPALYLFVSGSETWAVSPVSKQAHNCICANSRGNVKEVGTKVNVELLWGGGERLEEGSRKQRRVEWRLEQLHVQHSAPSCLRGNWQSAGGQRQPGKRKDRSPIATLLAIRTPAPDISSLILWVTKAVASAWIISQRVTWDLFSKKTKIQMIIQISSSCAIN